MKLYELLNRMDWGMRVNVICVDYDGLATDSTAEHHLRYAGDVVNDHDVWPVIKDWLVDNIWYSRTSERLVIEIKEVGEE